MGLVNTVVPERFKNLVASHVVMNLMEIPNLQTPLILGIHGPAGEGKTEQCRYILEKMGVKADWIFADKFESDKAGEPIRELKDKYMEMSYFNIKNRKDYKEKRMPANGYKFGALFINDIDQRIGRSDALIQQTVNTQLLNAFLMEVADAPNEVDGTKVCRVPIIVTGNDFSILYNPLKRDGRMEKFEWIPTIEEKAMVLRSIFPENSLSDHDIKALVSEFSSSTNRTSHQQDKPTLSISSFATIRYRLYKHQVVQLVQNVGIENILEFVYAGKHIQQLRHPFTSVDAIRNMAHELVQDGLLVNHLRS
jgi:hypothetical protein